MSDLTRLPWPFADDEHSYRYSVNVEPARRPVLTAAGGWGVDVVDLGDPTDDHAAYVELMAMRRAVLAADPGRRQVLPHMEPACWDMMMFLLGELAASYPERMHLDAGEDGRFHWRNDLLGIDQHFVLGDASTLPEDPLTFVACQVPDDVLLVSDREGRLWFDAGLVTWAGAWSVKFDVGMSLDEIHGPVPRLNEGGVTDRIGSFMRALTPDVVFRRLNWALSNHGSPRLDTSLELKDTWDDDLPALVASGQWGRLQLRIECEHLTRLPMTGSLTFNIRTYLAPLAEIAAVPGWGHQLADVMEELPPDVAEYKGIAEFRVAAARWLREASSKDGLS